MYRILPDPASHQSVAVLVHADRVLTASIYARIAADPPEATQSGISFGAYAVPAI